MDMKSFVMYCFMIIGILVCVVVSAIALVWTTCFVVRILIKSFKTKVNSFCEIAVEDIKEKSALKKEIKRKLRLAQKEQKEEALKIKLKSDKRIAEMKLKKLEEKLKAKESKLSLKFFGNYPLDTQDEEECSEIEENQYKEDIDEENITEETNQVMEECEESQTETQEQSSLIDDEDADYFDFDRVPSDSNLESINQAEETDTNDADEDTHIDEGQMKRQYSEFKFINEFNIDDEDDDFKTNNNLTEDISSSTGTEQELDINQIKDETSSQESEEEIINLNVDESSEKPKKKKNKKR